MSNLQSAKRLARAMGLRDLVALDDFLHARIEEAADSTAQERESKRDVVPGSARSVGGWTMQLEYVRCGKNCRTCGGGKGHGPYWYGYRTEGGRTVSKYFGKEPPGEGEVGGRRSRARSAGA
jgi:hypothetical protein